MTFNLFGGNTVECRACHELVSTDATECPHCGENLEGFKLFANTVECRACYEKVSTDATECPHCGENLEGFKLYGSTVECRACHEKVSTDATECPHCGEDFENFKLYGSTVECRACHEKVSTDAIECPHCGENLEGFKLFGSTVECRACHEMVSTDATECPHCGEDLSNSFFSSTPSNSSLHSNTGRQNNQSQRINTSESQSRSTYTYKEAEPSDWFIKWLFYIGLFIGAVWLAFAVALPLIIINCAAISFVVGLTFSSKNKKYMFLLSLLAGIYIIVDYNKGLLTKTLVNNVSFFEKAIPFFLFLNIVAALIASYFLTRDFIDERKPQLNEDGEFSKRNLIIMGTLLFIGGATIFIQTHFDSETYKSINNPVNEVPGGDANAPIPVTPNSGGGNSSSANNSNNYYSNGVFTGAWFKITAPSDFIVKPSMKSSSGSGYESAFFDSPDGDVEFYVFSPQWGGEPNDINIDANTEKVISTLTQTSNGLTKTWDVIQALDGSYYRSYQDTKTQGGNIHWIIGLKYKSKAAHEKYEKAYLSFKKSLTQFSD
jgi:RNA polymerase subunit RPABC4/transcription elongation factor Spt4